MPSAPRALRLGCRSPTSSEPPRVPRPAHLPRAPGDSAVGPGTVRSPAAGHARRCRRRGLSGMIGTSHSRDRHRGGGGAMATDGDRRFPRSVFEHGEDPDPRFSLANERTFLAWIRTGLAFVAAGLAVEALQVPLTA